MGAISPITPPSRQTGHRLTLARCCGCYRFCDPCPALPPAALFSKQVINPESRRESRGLRRLLKVVEKRVSASWVVPIGDPRLAHEKGRYHACNNEAALLPTEGRPGTATARLISGASGAIWLFAGPSASTVVSA
jgi:hypothetical protein